MIHKVRKYLTAAAALKAGALPRISRGLLCWCKNFRTQLRRAPPPTHPSCESSLLPDEGGGGELGGVMDQTSDSRQLSFLPACLPACWG